MVRNLLAVTLGILISPYCVAQIDQLQPQGIDPWGSYQHDEIESVNMLSGAPARTTVAELLAYRQHESIRDK